MNNEISQTDSSNQPSSDLKNMTGQRMMFRCYGKTMHTDTQDYEILVDSHDNLMILPDQKSKTFRKDALAWMYAIQAGKDHHCIERNGDRRIEITGNVVRVKPNVLVLSDLEYAYKDSHLTERDKTVKGTVVVDANRR